jgi:hypothetical protein
MNISAPPAYLSLSVLLQTDGAGLVEGALAVHVGRGRVCARRLAARGRVFTDLQLFDCTLRHLCH